MSTEVRQEADRFVISVDGTDAGFTAYHDADDRRTFPHTELDDAFSGQGLSGVLVEAALTATREEGLRIVPVCPLVAHWLTKHSEFDDVVDTPSTS